MKYSTRLSDAVHILTLIALNESPTLSSGAIAESIHTNPSYVRQFMAKLKKSGLINSYQGQAVPALSRKAEEITLLEIYKAVEGDKPLLHLDTHTNPLCQVGMNIQLALQEYYDKIQHSAEEDMSRITLQNVIDGYHAKLQTHFTKEEE